MNAIPGTAVTLGDQQVIVRDADRRKQTATLSIVSGTRAEAVVQVGLDSVFPIDMAPWRMTAFVSDGIEALLEFENQVDSSRFYLVFPY